MVHVFLAYTDSQTEKRPRFVRESPDQPRQLPIGLDKSGYWVNSFLISLQNMLWVLIRSALPGSSNEYPQHMFLLRNKKNIDTFWLKKVTLSRAMDAQTELSP